MTVCRFVKKKKSQSHSERVVSEDASLFSFCRQLMENQITVIERGAFDDMKELERL